MSHEDMMFGHAGVLVLVNDSCFHDPEFEDFNQDFWSAGACSC